MTGTAPSPSNPLLVLLDFVSSPILLFNAEGRVVFSNQAAKEMSCRPSLLLGSDPNVLGLVKDICDGKTVLHLKLRVDALSDNGIARLDCVCAPRPIAGLVAMSVSEAPVDAGEDTSETHEQPPQRLSLQEIMELIKADLEQPIEQVLSLTPPQGQEMLADSVRHLQGRLNRLHDLVNVFGDDVLIGDERILLPEVMRDIAQELAPLARSQKVTFIMEGDKGDLPPVYGSARLIRRALYECMHNAVQHARKGVPISETTAVSIHFRASGAHLLVNIQQMGAVSAAILEQHAAGIFRPAPAKGPAAQAQPLRLEIGLPLTHRIMQLHGGRLRIEEDAADGLSVKLELPTGAPVRSNHHLDMLQAQIYAEDLSKLMARTRQRSTS